MALLFFYGIYPIAFRIVGGHIAHRIVGLFCLRVGWVENSSWVLQPLPSREAQIGVGGSARLVGKYLSVVDRPKHM